MQILNSIKTNTTVAKNSNESEGNFYFQSNSVQSFLYEYNMIQRYTTIHPMTIKPYPDTT